MAAPVFQAVVSALDHASPVLATITRNINGLSGAALRAQVATQRLALASPAGFAQMRFGVAGVTSAFGRLRSGIGGVLSGVTSLLPPIAALGAGGSIAGLVGLVKHTADAREEVRHMAEAIGVTPEQLGRLGYAAQLTGTDVGAMETGMTRLNRVIGNATAGKNKDALALFQRIGVSMQELRTGNAATILPKIAAAFQKTESATLRGRMAFALFGRGGVQMIAMLARGSDELRRMGEEAARLKYAFTDADDKGLTRFRDSWIGLETAVGGFTDMLGARLAPVLTPVVEQFRDWIAANRAWIVGAQRAGFA